MHILTVLRLVPDIREDLPFEGAEIDYDDIDIMLNEFDDYALEEAVLLKEATGGTVTALGLPGDGIDRVLQTAIARGADHAVRMECDQQHLSSRAISTAFKTLVEELKPDLILTGVQTPEDMFGQLVPCLGEVLGWPHASGVTSVSGSSDGAVRIIQEYGGGRSALLEVELPAAIGIQASSQPPRYVAGSRLRQAIQSADIKGFSVDAPAEVSGLKITSLSQPARGEGAVMIDGDADEFAAALIKMLAERGLLEKNA
jgi:electron transfer flavoprotein beta subunit